MAGRFDRRPLRIRRPGGSLDVETKEAGTLNEAAYREAETRLWNSVGLAPTERHLRLGYSGTTVRVQEVGQGPPVLFLHGASNNGASWAGLAAHLQDFRCLLLDRPGTGLSEPLTKGFEDVAALAAFSDRLVVDVLDALGVEAAHLVATSYGGYSALRAAAAHPSRVRRMVMFGWTTGAANPPLPPLMRLAAIPSVGRVMAKLPVNERVVRAMFKRIGLRQAVESGRVSQETIDCYVALLRHTDTMLNDLEVGRWTMSWKGLDEDLVLQPSLLSKIEAPTYFLWGEEDPFGSPDVARDLVKQIPHAQLELLPNAGHAVWLDDPVHAAEVVKDHFRD